MLEMLARLLLRYDHALPKVFLRDREKDDGASIEAWLSQRWWPPKGVGSFFLWRVRQLKAELRDVARCEIHLG